MSRLLEARIRVFEASHNGKPGGGGPLVPITADSIQSKTRQLQRCRDILPRIASPSPELLPESFFPRVEPFNDFADAVVTYVGGEDLPSGGRTIKPQALRDNHYGAWFAIRRDTQTDNYKITALTTARSETVSFRETEVGGIGKILLPFLDTHIRVVLPEPPRYHSYVTDTQEPVFIDDIFRAENSRMLSGGQVLNFCQKIYTLCEQTQQAA